ncbi:MAG TPA: urate hydroxylase PuuD, partial [Burkholderiaceae bacterium]|nr:urate hydroxylase PuuD [Burkholderiaceae bacterium]
MESYLLDWANLLLRWLHVVTAIAWIGASFYFVWLDNHLLKPVSPDLKARGVDGELWAVHGGGFYNPQKYLVAPPDLPQHLHWFYWESYWTWMSGFALFTVLYLFNAESFLIDRRVHDWSAPAAIASALGFLSAGWLVYDQICRRFGHRKDGSIGNDGLVLGLIAVFVACAAWAACQLFAGRAAFLIVGAMIATIMSANVFFWIIPGQKQVIADMRAGRPVSPIHGQRGKQRSVHNTFLTAPVLVSMLSNHYGMLYSHAWNWVVLILLMLGGALTRTWFVKRHKGVNAWPLLVVVALMLATLLWLVKPASP